MRLVITAIILLFIAEPWEGSATFMARTAKPRKDQDAAGAVADERQKRADTEDGQEGEERDDDDDREAGEQDEGLVEVVSAPEVLRGPAEERETEEPPALDRLRSPVSRFLAETKRYPRLSDEEEKRLIK